jgi:hypothetical protein
MLFQWGLPCFHLFTSYYRWREYDALRGIHWLVEIANSYENGQPMVYRLTFPEIHCARGAGNSGMCTVQHVFPRVCDSRMHTWHLARLLPSSTRTSTWSTRILPEPLPTGMFFCRWWVLRDSYWFHIKAFTWFALTTLSFTNINPRSTYSLSHLLNRVFNLESGFTIFFDSTRSFKQGQLSICFKNIKFQFLKHKWNRYENLRNIHLYM